ncbi:MAG: restriction endonuclease subunit R, partial [Candidatus Eisenbacteria bacterium]
MSGRDPIVLQAEISRAEARLADLDDEQNRVTRHLSDLKAELSSLQMAEEQHQPPLQMAMPTGPAPTSSAQKVELFMDVFRGRTDVYPKRWVNTKKDTKGYSPACGNEWAPGLCDKRSVKCGECPNQAFIPVTEKTVHDHFQGRHVIGIYPMLPDETCWFLAVDFDKGQWQDDVTAFINTCKAKGVPHAVERSRSGNGAHVWFFFAAPVGASTARKMGCFLITETMARRHELPMTSYDRFFPNQDTMPRGGFGNLIALPFQDGPRQQGNSVFVDETWTPFADQWAFLSSVRRMQPADVEALAREAAETGQVIGVRMGESADDEDRATPWLRPPSRRRPKPVTT